MNRRDFLLGLVAAPLLIEPARTIFLPPRGGWFPDEFRMREVKQWSPNIDDIVYRYDAVFKDLVTGAETQVGVHMEQHGATQDQLAEIARESIGSYAKRHGLMICFRPKQLLMPLPANIPHARYV